MVSTNQRQHTPHAQAIHADLSDADKVREILRQIGPVDLITITAPCAPFSTAKHQPNSIAPDRRTELVTIATEAAAKAKPGAILLENVVGLRRSAVWQQAKLHMMTAGYNVEYTTVNAQYLGVPQNRNRFIVTAVRRPFATNVRMDPSGFGTCHL